MNDEIKEIKISKSNHSVVIIKNGVVVKEQFAIDDEILDYITNLQQENKRLHNRELELSYHLSLYSSEETMLKENKDLQRRIEKAVEYIEHSKFIKEQVIMKSNYDMQDFQIRELLNILNGRSDE